MAGGPGLKGVVIAVLLLGVLLITGCGKKGPPSPPGPHDEVVWPRTYPTH
jgi:hypothetical protein